MLVHPLARAPETRLTHYSVARPGTMDRRWRKIHHAITQTTEHLTTVARHYNTRSRHTATLKPKHIRYIYIVVYKPRQRAAFIIPVKNVSFKLFDYIRHRACAIARLVELYTNNTTILRQIERCPIEVQEWSR